MKEARPLYFCRQTNVRGLAMKRMMMAVGFCGVAAVCGCVSQSAYDSLVKENKELGERVAKIESDLYKVEIKTAPRKEDPPAKVQNFEPNKDVEIAVIDTKTEVFLKEYVGVKFGDDISLVRDDDESNGRSTRNIKMLKPFKHFDAAHLEYTGGKLTEVGILGRIEKKYSNDSVTKRFKEAKDDLALTLGYQEEFRLPIRLRREGKRPAVSIWGNKDTCNDHYRISIWFKNEEIVKSIYAAQNKAGEELPEVK